MWWYLFGIMALVVIISSIFNSSKPQEEDAGGYDDLLKMLGKQ